MPKNTTITTVENSNYRRCRFGNIVWLAGILLFSGCGGSAFLVPAPRGAAVEKTPQQPEQAADRKPEPEKKPEQHKKPEPDVAPLPEKTAPGVPREMVSLEDELDFAMAFVDSTVGEPLRQPQEPAAEARKAPQPAKALSITVPHVMVRVALARNVTRAVIYSFGAMQIRAGRSSDTASCRGRIAITADQERRSKPRVVIEALTGGRREALLPCTLHAGSTENYFEFNDKRYRGSVILAEEKSGSFTVVNYCPVEEYLRGVVPLEIGRRTEKDFEAVKAQAVAARTYTYKKNLVRARAPFDLVATVADQVYGGVNAEYPLSDHAILQTKDMVLAHADTLIYAYYHSTCGGLTANIEDVWNKKAAPYLRSVRDVDSNGVAWCAISRYVTWEETWKNSTLSSILWRYTHKNSPDHFPLKGSIKNIVVAERFPCGRISACRVLSSGSVYEYGGDRIRFIFRRDAKEYPILRSANFEVVSVDAKEVRLKGKGYGHGVGLCQMGALGRARAGQPFGAILDAYYTGSYLATVKTTAKRDITHDE